MWEYEVVHWAWKGIQGNSSELTKRGAAGWELVGIFDGLMTGSDVPLAVFKRRKS